MTESKNISDILNETELKELRRILNKLRKVHSKYNCNGCYDVCPLDGCGCMYEDLIDLLCNLDEVIKNDVE